MCSALRIFPNLFGLLNYVSVCSVPSAAGQVNYNLRLAVRSVTINASNSLSMPVSAYKQILLPLCNGCLAFLSPAHLQHRFIAAICKVPNFVPHIHFCAYTPFVFPSGLSSRILCNSPIPNRRTHDAEIFFTSVKTGRSVSLQLTTFYFVDRASCNDSW